MYIANGNPDIAHTMGNATYIMTEFIKDLFPRDFFRYVHIGTTIAYREFMQHENLLRPAMMKKVRPILVVRPKPIFFDDDIFMARTNLTWPIMSTENNPDRSNYIKVFRDDKNDITLSYMMNRMRVQFSSLLMFDTEIQQQNIYLQLRNRFIPDRPYWKKVSMEIMIPKNFIQYISKLSGVPIHDPETGSVRPFLEYFMAHSNKYITYKQNAGTNNDEFFVYYPLTMELVFSDFDISDPNKKGQVTEWAGISFTFTSEFNTIGMYQLSTERDDTELRANAEVKIDSTVNAGMHIVPMFTVNNLFRAEDENGYRLFFTNMFAIDPDLKPHEPDIIDLHPVFKDTKNDFSEVLEYYDKNGLDWHTLFHFIIMKNSDCLNDDKRKGKVDYVVDMDKRRILLFNKNENATYRFVAYVNNQQILSVMNTLHNYEKSYESEGQENPNRQKRVLRDDDSKD